MTVTLDYWERKKRLPRGSVVRIAAKRQVSASYVSLVLRTGQGTPQIKRDLARAMGVPVARAFPPAGRLATPDVPMRSDESLGLAHDHDTATAA